MVKGNDKDNLLKLFYILSMTAAFIPRFGNTIVNRNIRMIIGLFWILYVLLNLVVNRFKPVMNRESDFMWLMGSYFMPTLIIHLWTLVLMLLGVLSWTNFTTNATTYIPTLLAISSIYIFREKAFRFNFYSLVSAYIISMTSAILVSPTLVLGNLIKVFAQFGISGSNYFELGDIVLSIGMVLTYYIFSQERLTRKNLSVIFFTLLIMILGLKRISVLGVFLAAIFHRIIKKLQPKTQYKVCRIGGTIFIAGCFLFVWLLINGDSFWKLVGPLGINFMGRNYYWSALADRCTFSPTFLGLGRNYSYLLFSGELSYMHVGAAHSDILKMYAENGFIFFTYWLCHYLLNLTKRYKEKFSIDAAVVYFGISIYLFTMYFTDNVETYFASILFSIVIPASHALKSREKQ